MFLLHLCNEFNPRNLFTFRMVIMYFILPETEGCTLEDIEIHFSDNSRKLTDRYIVRHSENKQKEIC